MRKDDVSVTTYFELTGYRLCSDLVLKTGIPVDYLYWSSCRLQFPNCSSVQFSFSDANEA